MLQQKIIDTPFLPMVLVSNGTHLVKCDFLYDTNTCCLYEGIAIADDDILIETATQLQDYFSKKRQNFQLPLLIEGTEFRQKVWQILQTIPYGDVFTYKQIAERIGSPKAFQATGGACKANPFPVIIPCHRVVAVDGAYTGYAGDKTFMKENLLKFEGYNPHNS